MLNKINEFEDNSIEKVLKLTKNISELHAEIYNTLEVCRIFNFFKKEIELYEQDINDLKREKNKLEKKLDSGEKRFESLKSEYGSKCNENRDLNEKINYLEKELSNKEEDLLDNHIKSVIRPLLGDIDKYLDLKKSKNKNKKEIVSEIKGLNDGTKQTLDQIDIEVIFPKEGDKFNSKLHELDSSFEKKENMGRSIKNVGKRGYKFKNGKVIERAIVKIE